jgi:hypothetical protein
MTTDYLLEQLKLLKRRDHSKLTPAQRERMDEDLKTLELRLLRESFEAPGGLRRFIEHFWPIVEPACPLIDGWPLVAICDHLEAVANGQIRRLLMNVPPGFMKSMCTNVFFPA